MGDLQRSGSTYNTTSTTETIKHGWANPSQLPGPSPIASAISREGGQSFAEKSNKRARGEEDHTAETDRYRGRSRLRSAQNLNSSPVPPHPSLSDSWSPSTPSLYVPRDPRLETPSKPSNSSLLGTKLTVFDNGTSLGLFSSSSQSSEWSYSSSSTASRYQPPPISAPQITSSPSLTPNLAVEPTYPYHSHQNLAAPAQSSYRPQNALQAQGKSFSPQSSVDATQTKDPRQRDANGNRIIPKRLMSQADAASTTRNPVSLVIMKVEDPETSALLRRHAQKRPSGDDHNMSKGAIFPKKEPMQQRYSVSAAEEQFIDSVIQAVRNHRESNQELYASPVDSSPQTPSPVLKPTLLPRLETVPPLLAKPEISPVGTTGPRHLSDLTGDLRSSRSISPDLQPSSTGLRSFQFSSSSRIRGESDSYAPELTSVAEANQSGGVHPRSEMSHVERVGAIPGTFEDILSLPIEKRRVVLVSHKLHLGRLESELMAAEERVTEKKWIIEAIEKSLERDGDDV